MTMNPAAAVERKVTFHKTSWIVYFCVNIDVKNMLWNYEVTNF